MDVIQSPIPELPARRFCSLDVKPALDADGFLSDATKRTSGVDELLAGASTLVVAPPWTGKTFVARRIQAHFRITGDGPGVSEAKSTFAELRHFTLFEEAAVSIVPRWWQQWKDGDGRALWLIDALDEDLRTGGLSTDEILKCLAETKEEELDRLTLVLLCREAELPKKVRDKLQQLLPSLATVRLARLTRVEAIELLGGQDAFDRVSHTIARHNLQGLAGLPATLLALKGLGAEAEITPVVVWRRVLERMLHHERASDTEHSLRVDPPIEDRFDVAGRVAATLLLAGEDEFARDVFHQSTAPLLEDIIPKTTLRHERLRVAADAVRQTAVLQRTADGYRFAQQHVQEWFAAFELRNIKLSRLRPLVCDETGRLSKHLLGLLGNLYEITGEGEVREWLVGASGGLGPRSDSMPWTLKQAIAALDRLQEHARQTDFGLHPLSLPGLDRLDTPGMGPEIAKRLLDKSLTVGERRLIVELASEIEPPGIADALEQVVADGTEEMHLRVSCGIRLRSIGSREHFRHLESVATDVDLKSDQGNRLRSLIVLGLYEYDEWSFDRAASYAPPPSEHVFDATSMLRAVLKEKMTLDDARHLLEHSPPADWTGQARRGPSEPSLRVYALQLVVGQDTLSKSDYELLIPLVFRTSRPPGFDSHFQLVGVFRKSREARRGLFVKGMQVNTSDEAPEFAWLRGALVGEDAEWLEELVTDRDERPPWLLGTLLSLTYMDGVLLPIRLRARKLVKALNPDFLEEFDRGRRRAREQRHRFEREQDEQRRQVQSQVSVSDAAQKTLKSRLMLQQKMWEFGRTCFASEQTRPHNLIGEWNDLPPEVKAQVLATCERALSECTATAVPVGTSYPAAVVYESYVFQAVLHSSRSYRLDAEQIARWLQSALIFSRSEHGSTLERCAEVDQSATELVLLGEMRRTMSTDESYAGTVIHSALWSPGLIDGTFHLIRDDSLPTKGRSHLLRVVARYAREPAMEVAKEWLSGERAGNKESRAAALDVLLMWDPSDALDRLDPIVASDASALFDLRTIASRGDRSLIDLDRWPIEAVEKFAHLLHQHFPVDTDTEYEGVHSVGHEDEVRELRNRVTGWLVERPDPDAGAALDRLALKFPSIEKWRRHAVANRDAAQSLKSPKVSVEKIVRLLDESQFRLIRSADDLQRVLLEELGEIQKSVKEHLSVLYEPLAKKGVAREPLREDALQAYLFCRLNDRLPGRVLEPDTKAYFINREPLAAKDQRLDIKVEAPTLSGDTVTVVIEIKWVKNRDVGTSMREQLANEYLLGAHLTHGIYLVGWGGSHRSGLKHLGIVLASKMCLDAWRSALIRQATEITDEYPELHIEPLIIDLEWTLRGNPLGVVPGRRRSEQK